MDNLSGPHIYQEYLCQRSTNNPAVLVMPQSLYIISEQTPRGTHPSCSPGHASLVCCLQSIQDLDGKECYSHPESLRHNTSCHPKWWILMNLSFLMDWQSSKHNFHCKPLSTYRKYSCYFRNRGLKVLKIL